MSCRVCLVLLLVVCVQSMAQTTDPDSALLKKVFKQQKKTKKAVLEVQKAVDVFIRDDGGADEDAKENDNIEVPVRSAEYLGCYRDRSVRLLSDLKVVSSSLTVEMCLAMCGARGFKYSGVQHANECFCGNTADFDAYGKRPEEECWKPCTGNREQVCGGVWRMSVYEMKYT